MPRKPIPLSVNDLLGGLVDDLNRQAVEPNLLGYEPHDKQVTFHKSEAKQKLFIGGNRSGKSVAGIVEDLWWVSRRHPYRRIPSETEIRCRILGDGFENGNINQNLIPLVKRWLVPSDLKKGSWEESWSASSRTLTLDNGSFLEFKSYDQEVQKHAGTSRHLIHFDEEPPQAIFAESMMRLIDVAGSWHMTMTPLNGMNWVYDDLYVPALSDKIDDFLIVEVETSDNPHVKLEDVTALLSHLSETEREQRLSGKFAERGGKVFPDFNIAHLKSGSWYPKDHGFWRIYQSLDHGLNNPTAILWHAVSPENQVITFGEHYASEMLVHEHAEKIKEFELEHAINRVFSRPADPALKQRQGVTGTSIVQEYALNGIYLNVETIPRDVATGLDRMRKYMKLSGQTKLPRWQIVADQCPNLVRELKRLSWDTYASAKQRDSKNKLDRIKQKDDHAFDSARYFFTMMPDLTPDDHWKPIQEKNRLGRTYIDVLTEMAETRRITAWKPSARGFSDNEYAFADNMEGI